MSCHLTKVFNDKVTHTKIFPGFYFVLVFGITGDQTQGLHTLPGSSLAFVSFWFLVALGIKPRALHTLGRNSLLLTCVPSPPFSGF